MRMRVKLEKVIGNWLEIYIYLIPEPLLIEANPNEIENVCTYGLLSGNSTLPHH